MSVLRRAYPHSLGQEEALRRVKTLFPKLEQGDSVSGVRQIWEGNEVTFGFVVKGTIEIKGTITVDEHQIVLSADLPSYAKVSFDQIVSREINALIQAQTV
ncbi:MAG: polyhydroxyalkanoic acid system family protein [Patescibacteria group bacterium]|nr:polyhydroxyalkanoic acid system family protein [Patescibacteria group bacterium]